MHDLAASSGTMAWPKKCQFNEFSSIDLSLASQSETRPSRASVISRCPSYANEQSIIVVRLHYAADSHGA